MMEIGTKVMVNREGDLCDGSEGVVLDPSTFAYEGDLIPVSLPMETDGELHKVERFYSADALEVVETDDGWGDPIPGREALWDLSAEWAPLTSEALTELLANRYETITYIIRLESAVAVLRERQAVSDRFFDAVNELDPGVCGDAFDAAKDRVAT